MKKADKYYAEGSSYEEDIQALKESADALGACRPEAYSKEVEKIVTDMLMRLSDIARICKISSEQALADRIEDLIDQYEK